LRFYAEIPRYSLHALLRLLYGRDWWQYIYNKKQLYHKLNEVKYSLRDILLHVPIIQGDKLIIRVPALHFTIVCDYLDPENLNSIRGNIIHLLYDEVYTRNLGISQNDVVVDVGAHIGIFTLYAARRGRMVIAVEPEPRNYKWLLINTRLNNVKNVRLLNIALSDFDGEAHLYISSESIAHTLVPDVTTRTKDVIGSLRVPVRRLDSVLREHVDKSDELFVKVDVEGAELNVLKGFTIGNSVKFSIAAYHYPEEYRQIYEYLRKMGFVAMVKYWEEGPYVYAWRSARR
jgi:FkbM family methyltransferase